MKLADQLRVLTEESRADSYESLRKYLTEVASKEAVKGKHSATVSSTVLLKIAKSRRNLEVFLQSEGLKYKHHNDPRDGGYYEISWT